MSKSNIGRKTVDWRPEWEGDDLKKYNEYRDGFRAQVSSFRELRGALELSQAEAAQRLATSQSNVSKIETKSDPSLSTLRELVGDQGVLHVIVRLKDGKEIELLSEH